MIVYTDSLSLLHGLRTGMFKAGRRARRRRPHAPLIRAILEQMALRTGRVHLVKVKSHMGMEWNARADEQAELGLQMDEGTTELVEGYTCRLQFARRRPSPPQPMSEFTRERAEKRGREPAEGQQDGEDPGGGADEPLGWSEQDGANKTLLRKLVHEQVDKLIQAEPTVYTSLLRRGECMLAAIAGLRKLSGPERRVWIQMAAAIYPTQSYLQRIRVSESADCTHCPGKRETLGHFVGRCSQFGNTRTEAHNRAWAAVGSAMVPLFPLGRQVFWDKPMWHTGLKLARVTVPDPEVHGQHLVREPSALAELQPDAVVIDSQRRRIHLLEFTRPYDSWGEELWRAATRKTEKYQVLLHALREYRRSGWTVSLHPLPGRGAGHLAPGSMDPDNGAARHRGPAPSIPDGGGSG